MNIQRNTTIVINKALKAKKFSSLFIVFLSVLVTLSCTMEDTKKDTRKAITGSFTYPGITVFEGTPKAETLQWTGGNAAQTVSYSIASAPTGITVDSSTGELRVSSEALESVATYTITATGTGNYKGSIEGTVLIEVKQNGLSSFSLAYDAITISETKVYKADPRWTRGTPSVTYAVVSPTGGAGISVDAASGTVSVEAAIVKSGSYTITATAGSGASQASITVDRPTPVDRAELQKLLDAAIQLNSTVDLNYIDTSRVTDMSYMFETATTFNGDISKWDVSSTTNMSSMFKQVAAFNGDLNKWNVSSVTNMNGMFQSAAAFNQDLNKWNVSSVTNMNGMFQNAAAFNQDLNKWDVCSVTSMYSMFYGATAFNGKISDWKVSSVKDMRNMFFSAAAFNQDLNKWGVAALVTKTNMFQGSGLESNPPRWYLNP